MEILEKYLGESRNMNITDRLQQNISAIISASDEKNAKKAKALDKKYKTKKLSKDEEEWVYKTIRKNF